MKTNLLGTLAASALLLSGCGERGQEDWADSEALVSENRYLSDFDSIRLEGATKLEITIGEPVSVQVNGHQSAVERVVTEVDGDTLQIKGKARDWIVRNNNSRLTVQITLPKLESLQVEGGNDVTMVGFNGGETRIKASGAANIKAEGHLDELNMRMSGAGNADLSKLLVADAKVTVDGVGNMVVNAVESLDATMNGVGAIFYTGTPRRVNTRMNGLGTISQRGDGDAGAAPESGSRPPAPVDPDSLQLEREESPKHKPGEKPANPPANKSEQVNHEDKHIIVI